VVLVGHSSTPQLRLVFVLRGEERKSLEYFGIALEKCAIIQKDFHQKFKPVRKLGKGATAAVYSAVRTRDGAVVAVKAFNKSTQFAVGDGKGQVTMELCREPWNRSYAYWPRASTKAFVGSMVPLRPKTASTW
jgi:hypothetical protein